MKAVIMAGGEGTRLRPLTCDLPKPMVPVLNKPVMQHIIELLKKHGITDIAVTLAYLPGKIKDYFQDGRDFDVNLKYFVEDTPLGTAGSIKNAMDFLDSDFVVISGDALTDIDLGKAIDFHLKNKAVATLILKKVEVPLEYGVVVTEESGRIQRFLEKPSWSEVISDTVNTGIYVLSPEVLKGLNEGDKADFGKDIFPQLLADGKPLFGYVSNGYWCDIGDVKAYMMASRDAVKGKVQINKKGFEFFKDVWIDEGSTVEEGANVSSNCIIGRNCKIAKGAVIGENTIIGNGVTIESGCRIRGSIIWDNTVVCQNVELRDNVVCNKVRLGRGVRAFDGSIIGFGCDVRDNATIQADVKIWPGKVIDDETEVCENIVFGKGASKGQVVGLPEEMAVFGGRGIKAKLNCDIFPDQISRVGVSFAAVMSPGAKVAVATDGSARSQMAAMSFMGGAMAQGARVFDCGTMTIPVLRYAIQQYNMEGGAFFNGESGDVLEIIFIDSLGCDFNRDMDRKLKSIYRKNDFTLSQAADIRGYERLTGLNGQYVASRSKQVGDLKGLTITIGGDENMCNIASEVFRDNGAKVRAFDADEQDLGVIFQPNGEHLELFDENKKAINSEELSIITSSILFEKYDNLTMIVPISESDVHSRLANAKNTKILRSGSSSRDIMNKIADNLMSDGAQAQFNMRYDAVSCILLICDYLNSNKITLSDLAHKLPPVYIEQRDVACDFSKKGSVMRFMMEDSQGRPIETIDGVKVYNDKGWVLILPDSDSPTCRIVTESDNEEYSKELADIYTEKIRNITQQ